eukprot:jgi/Hompol1/2256/HPOL_005907-RA
MRQVAASEPWFNGRLGLTYVEGFSQQGYISIEDLIDRSTLKKACFSTFVIEEEWLFSKLPPNIRVCIARPRPKDLPQTTKNLEIDSNLLYVFPPMPNPKQYGSMHIKFMLLFYKEFVRVVIPSANLVSYDWTLQENIVYSQDFPLLPDGVAQDPKSFGSDIARVLGLMGIPPSVINSLLLFDFRNARGKLVASIPGEYDINDVTWGHNRLADCVAQTLEGDSPLVLDDPVITMQAGGSFFFNIKYWDDKFPKTVMCDSLSSRRGVLSHSKIILCHSRDRTSKIGKSAHLCIPSCNGLPPDGWMYC